MGLVFTAIEIFHSHSSVAWSSQGRPSVLQMEQVSANTDNQPDPNNPILEIKHKRLLKIMIDD